MTFTERLADRVLATSHRDLPLETLHWARVSVLDTLGVAVAGSGEAGVRILERGLAPNYLNGECLVFGSDRRTSLLDAAMINGMAAHVLDYDASNPHFAGHATMHLLAATYALAEKLDASGKDFLTAYVVGFEAQSRIARGLQPAHSDKGWFPSSTLGVFGVAAAAAKLMDLSRRQLATALGVAANMASGILACSGSLAKPLAAGHSARNGLLAAQLAADGFTAPPDAFEHTYGFINLFDVGGEFYDRDCLSGWGEPFEIGVTAVGLKRHPCCGSSHAPIDLLGALIAEHKIAPQQIERVDVALMSDRVAHIDRPNPANDIDAKFSGHYCLARTILDGRPRLDHFRNGAYHDRAVGPLMARIHLGAHPDLRKNAPRTEQGGADVTIALADGRTIQGSIGEPFGRKPGAPLPENLLFEKFLDCADQALKPHASQHLLERVWTCDQQQSIRLISDAMSEPGSLKPATSEARRT